jgi:alkylation response protein AidB-like acyl-CoA dehydrogenase
VQNSLGLGLGIERLGSPTQHGRYLTALCAGELRGTTALANPSDALDVRPTLVATPGAAGGDAEVLVVNGDLTLVADADLADVLLVSARLVSATAPHCVVGLVIDAASPGVTVEPKRTIEGNNACRVVLRDVAVPQEAVLAGPRGNGLAADDLRWVTHALSALQCLEIVGGAEAVLKRTVEHTTTRHQFGRPIGSFQAAQHLVADMHIALEAARLAARSAVFWLGRGQLATRQVAVARMHAATAGKHISLDAHQLHGGMGYVLETDLHLWSARARSLATLGGTADTAARWLEQEVDLD